MSQVSSTFSQDLPLPGTDQDSPKVVHSIPTPPNPVQSLLQENQSLQEQIATQTQLMHLLTHQLATPLTSLQGSVNLLAEESLTLEQQQEFLALVQQQVQRLQDLLKGLMALRDLETGTIATKPHVFCIQSLIEESVASLQPQPVVTYEFSEALPRVWGDRWQVSQVLINLLSNAVKYTPDQRPIQIGAKLHQANWVEVWVQDQGLGIPASDQPRLFERFYRVKHRDRQSIEGTGLGLSLCKLLIEKQGGQIGCESTHGQGSRFYFTLPVTEAIAL